MLLSVIIVSYNTKALTLETLESVFKSIESSERLREASEVWVVDNDSTDSSVEAIKKFGLQHLSLHLIQNGDNLGFAAANNQAIKKTSGEYVLLLNSDTIVQKDALEKLVESFEAEGEKSKHLGVVAAQLLNQDGTIQHQGGSFPTLISLATQMLLLDDLPVVGQLLPSTQHTGKNSRTHTESLYLQDWVGGTAMMIRRAVFAEVGLLDDAIFMYGEDIEFCMRAKFHLWDVAIQPVAQITHLGSASSSSKNAIIGELKGYIYIWAKHKPLWQQGLAKTLILIGVVLRIILFGTMIRDSHRAAIYKQAYQVLKTL